MSAAQPVGICGFVGLRGWLGQPPQKDFDRETGGVNKRNYFLATSARVHFDRLKIAQASSLLSLPRHENDVTLIPPVASRSRPSPPESLAQQHLHSSYLLVSLFIHCASVEEQLAGSSPNLNPLFGRCREVVALSNGPSSMPERKKTVIRQSRVGVLVTGLKLTGEGYR
jgi:hypothetical protein